MYYDAAVSELAWYIYLYMQSVVITTNVMISIFARAEVYSMQHYVIKNVSYFWQVGIPT